MKASDLMVRCLEAEGVEYIFGIPGEENIDFMDSLARSTIQFILARHEQGAAFMADMYGRLTGKPGVCLATLGPGATNLITGVANAHLDRSPLIAITAQVDRIHLHKEFHQNIDTIQLFEGITKYNQQILSADTIPEIIRKSFDMATEESPGAIHLQLPADVAREEVVSCSPLKIGKRVKIRPNIEMLQTAAQLIKNAKKPIILAGNGVIRNGASEGVRKLVEKANLPMVNSFMAKGILPFEHSRNLFTIGGKPTYENLRPLIESDLVIAIGFDLVEYNPIFWNEDKSRKILHIHNMKAETDAHFQVELDLVGNLEETLRNLTELVEPKPVPVEYNLIRASREKELQSIASPEQNLPRKVMLTLGEKLPENCIVISDVGLHKMWVSNWYQPKTPGHTIIFNGLASMGASLPGAIASRLAKPEFPVIVVSGDGGFLMNSQELETAKRLGLTFTVIIFNNQSYGLIKKHQSDADLAVTQVNFTNPDFNLYAQSFGISYRGVKNAEEFSQVLTEAVQSRELNLIEIIL
ncbi:acetolactate synthase large subunit [Niallia taxi]|uniref:acetolactate synthase large subunit n=1 Tax=Niallia taxi TaxID=2499688 RepID=UPI003008901A